MRFTLHDHQGKGDAFRTALLAAGWLETPGPADLLLIDHDVPGFHRQTIEAHAAQGAKVVLYPHGAMPLVSWDGLFEPSGLVALTLTPAPGQRDVLGWYGYPGPTAVVGWSMCPLRKFRPGPEPRTVLFAPYHPTNGDLHPAAQEANARTFAALLAYAPETLVVRYSELETSGLWDVEGVVYHEMDLNLAGALDDIARADLVVATGTLAYLAVASGKPTVFFGQEVCPWEKTSTGYRYAQLFMEYCDFLRFPVHYDGGPLGPYVEAAFTEGPEVREWKARFIGPPFNPAHFVKMMTRVVTGEE